MNKLTLEKIKGVLRHVLSLVGGVLISLGLITKLTPETLQTIISLTDNILGSLELLIGSTVTLVAIIKSLLQKEESQ